MTSELVNCPPDCTCTGSQHRRLDEVPMRRHTFTVAEHLATCDLPLALCWICKTEFGIVKVLDDGT